MDSGMRRLSPGISIKMPPIFAEIETMITGLFETHIEVANLEAAMTFYSRLPGLILAHLEAKRRIAFYWIGQPGEAMLGLWETKDRPVHPRHFAFRCMAEHFTEKAASFLAQHHLDGYNFYRTAALNPWSLPGCRPSPFISKTPTGMSWN